MHIVILNTHYARLFISFILLYNKQLGLRPKKQEMGMPFVQKGMGALNNVKEYCHISYTADFYFL